MSLIKDFLIRLLIKDFYNESYLCNISRNQRFKDFFSLRNVCLLNNKGKDFSGFNYEPKSSFLYRQL